MSVTRVAIAGMTGKFARLITTHLLSKPNVEINGFCRTPSKVPQEISADPRVKVFEASSEDTEKIRQAIRGTDICICCYLGDESLMEAGQKHLIDACIAERVPRFMDSGYTFDYRNLEMGAAPQKDFCKKVQAYLEQNAGQIKPVQVLNGAFMEVCFAPFYGLFSSEGPTLQYWGTGDEKLEMTTYADAARFAGEVALDEKAVGYQSGKPNFPYITSILLMICTSTRRPKERQRDCLRY
jgi:NAD(P)H-binding